MVKVFVSLCSYSTRGCICGSERISMETVCIIMMKVLQSNKGIGVNVDE